MNETTEETTTVITEPRISRNTLANVAKGVLVVGVIGAIGGVVGAKLAQSNDNE